MATTDNFYEDQAEKSKVKTLIVTDFLKAYLPIINASVGKDCDKIYYIDLFSGPGRYKDGAPSTPIKLFDLINNFKNEDYKKKLHYVFNDKEKAFFESLCSNLAAHEIWQEVKDKVSITNTCASEVDLTHILSTRNPVFSFIDPWGYIDISANQIWSLVENIGSDCVLFFSANRILMDINKPECQEHFKLLFGSELSNAKNVYLKNLSTTEKMDKLLYYFSKNLYSTMKSSNYKYKLYLHPFYFKFDDKEKISHYIVFISKNHKAIIEMKKVMLLHSNSTHTQLGFDDKDSVRLSFFNRSDDIIRTGSEYIKAFLSSNSLLMDKVFNITSLMKAIDDFSMEQNYTTTPYALSDIKSIVENLDKESFIDINIDENQGLNMKKRITNDRNFKFATRILGGTNV